MAETILSQPSAKWVPWKWEPKGGGSGKNPEGFPAVLLRHGKQASPLHGASQQAPPEPSSSFFHRWAGDVWLSQLSSQALPKSILNPGCTVSQLTSSGAHLADPWWPDPVHSFRSFTSFRLLSHQRKKKKVKGWVLPDADPGRRMFYVRGDPRKRW